MSVATPHPLVAKPTRYTVRDRDGQIIGKAELRQVPVSAIKVDHEYQRDISSHWIAEHLPFDPQKAGAVVLSDRAGGPYCIDGQHRLALARESGLAHINAYVIEGLAKADEARLFVQYQRERRNLTSFALFRAEQVAGDPETLAMIRVVHSAGFKLSNKSSGQPTVITAIDAIRYAHRLGGDDLLGRTLGLIHDVWFGERKATASAAIRGLALFLQSAGSQPMFKIDRLRRVMEDFAPSKLEREASAIAIRRNAATVGPANFAEAILEKYNKVVPKGEQPLPTLTIGPRKRPSPRNARS